MKNGIYFTFILLFINISAQVNTEKYRTSDDLRGLAGFLELSGTIKTGNADKTEGNLDGRLDWKTEGTQTFFVFQSEHEWVNGERLSNEGLLHIRNVIKLDSNLSSEIFGQINYDKKILIDNRELIGGGIRYRLFDFESGDIFLGTAYMFEHENYNLTESADHPAEVKVSRWSNYISFYLQINSNVLLGGMLYYQPMFSNFTDYRLLSENSLSVSLTKLLSVSINFRIRHDFLPPDGIEKTDTKTDFGIALKF